MPVIHGEGGVLKVNASSGDLLYALATRDVKFWDSGAIPFIPVQVLSINDNFSIQVRFVMNIKSIFYNYSKRSNENSKQNL